MTAALLFFEIVSVSLSAAVLAGVLLLLRAVFRKSSQRLRILFWIPLGLRLSLPLLIPQKAAKLMHSLLIEVPRLTKDRGAYLAHYLENNTASAPSVSDYAVGLVTYGKAFYVALLLWAVVSSGLLLRGLFLHFCMRKRLADSVPVHDCIYRNEHIADPFTMGVLHPKIFLPFSVSKEDEAFILAHEKGHVARKDCLWKNIAYLFVCIYWFNPVLLAAYYLFCGDIEKACDETVLAGKDRIYRSEYARILVEMSSRKKPRTSLSYVILRFEENRLEERIKAIMIPRKDTTFIRCAGKITVVGLCAALIVLLLLPFNGRNGFAVKCLDSMEMFVRNNEMPFWIEGTIVGYSQDYKGRRIVVLEGRQIKIDAHGQITHTEESLDTFYLLFSEESTQVICYFDEYYSGEADLYDTRVFAQIDEGTVGQFFHMIHGASPGKSYDPYPWIVDFAAYVQATP